MSAYMVVLLRNRNRDWLPGYVAKVPAILRSYGGEYIAVSKSVRRLEGAGDLPEIIALFSFPSLAHIEEFMSSDEYRPLRKLRQENADADILIFEGGRTP